MKVREMQLIYDTLKIIANRYESPSKLRKDCQRTYGLTYEEALEMAYENILEDARAAIRGVRRPKEAK